MPAQPAPAVREPAPWFALDPVHRHTAGCFWDLEQCRWQCGPPAATGPDIPPTSRIDEH